MKPPPALHRWYRIAPRPSPWWLLERSRRGGESELVQCPGLVSGDTYECVQCGIVRVFTRLTDGEGGSFEVALYGFTFDALSPMRAPSCEALERPTLAEALEELADDAQQGAAA